MPTPKKPAGGLSVPGRIRTLLGTALCAGVVLGTTVACGGQPDLGAPVAGVSEVTVRDNEFAPAAITVPVGTTVTWRWAGDSRHNVVGDEFASPVQESGEFAQTFSEPGTYDYRCTLHGAMRGEVVVTEATG